MSRAAPSAVIAAGSDQAGPQAAPVPPIRRLAIYLHDLSGGGVERMRLELVRGFQACGIEVTLVLHRRTGKLADQVPPGVRVVELGGRRTAADVLPLARFLRTERPDLLMASLDHNNIAALLARRLSALPLGSTPQAAPLARQEHAADRVPPWAGAAGAGRTRLVICQHNALSAEAEHMAGLRYRAVPLFYRLLQNGADGIVAVSAGVADDLSRMAGISRGRIDVIHNPVIGADFEARAGQPAVDAWLHEGAPVFVSVGRLVEQKDPHTLLRAFAAVPAPARLLLLGEGDLRPELEVLAERLGIAGRVRFAGFRANPLPAMRAATALVLSSRYEGLGNVLIEALGCGTPVISTDCPHGPAEILDGGRFGTLVPVGNPDALASAMRAALLQPRRAGLLRERAAEFSAQACVRRHLDLFARAVAS